MSAERSGISELNRALADLQAAARAGMQVRLGPASSSEQVAAVTHRFPYAPEELVQWIGMVAWVSSPEIVLYGTLRNEPGGVCLTDEANCVTWRPERVLLSSDAAGCHFALDASAPTDEACRAAPVFFLDTANWDDIEFHIATGYSKFVRMVALATLRGLSIDEWVSNREFVLDIDPELQSRSELVLPW